MAYNKEPAERIRKIMAKNTGYNEKKIFGGICYLLHGKIACGVLKPLLMHDRRYE